MGKRFVKDVLISFFFLKKLLDLQLTLCDVKMNYNVIKVGQKNNLLYRAKFRPLN
jgi:hypothetical protein